MRNDEADEVQWCNGEEMELEEYAGEWEGTERQGTGRRWRSMQAVSRRAKRAEWSIGMDWEMDRCVDREGDKGWQWKRPWQCEEGIDWLTVSRKWSGEVRRRGGPAVTSVRLLAESQCTQIYYILDCSAKSCSLQAAGHFSLLAHDPCYFKLVSSCSNYEKIKRGCQVELGVSLVRWTSQWKTSRISCFIQIHNCNNIAHCNHGSLQPQRSRPTFLKPHRNSQVSY